MHIGTRKHPGHRARRPVRRTRYLLVYVPRCGECGYRRSRCRCQVWRGR